MAAQCLTGFVEFKTMFASELFGSILGLEELNRHGSLFKLALGLTLSFFTAFSFYLTVLSDLATSPFLDAQTNYLRHFFFVIFLVVNLLLSYKLTLLGSLG